MWKFDGTCNLHATKDRYSKKKSKCSCQTLLSQRFIVVYLRKLLLGKTVIG